jgi:hypothetical protein
MIHSYPSRVIFSFLGKAASSNILIPFIKPSQTKQNELYFQEYVMIINIVPGALIQ